MSRWLAVAGVVWLLTVAGCNCRSVDTPPDTGEPAEVDLDGDGHASIEHGGDDCDDDNKFVHPGAFEICDGADNDCDQQVDEDALDAMTWYDDDDEDGFGDPEETVESCGPPSGFVADGTDCDDTDPATYPGADEVPADDTDQDCDGDEECYLDEDLDTFAGSTTVISADLDCDDPGEGYAARDCDDDDPSTHPGAALLDSESDCMSDADGDGYGDADPDLGIDPGTDCDDTDPATYPEAAEVVADGVDQDCDTDELCWEDLDDDGFGGTGGTTVASVDLDCDDPGEASTIDDCDDEDDATYPGADEVVADGTDQDCDGLELCLQDLDLDGHGTAWTVPSTDLDCEDTGESTTADDCDDDDSLIYPGAEESPADGVDSDCDGSETCYADTDGDGFGEDELVSSPDPLCIGEGEATLAGDCDDEDATTYPGADEVVADGTDQDCDGSDLCYTDGDHDGVGSELTLLAPDLDCDDEGESAIAGDCDDEDGDVHPEADELPADDTDQDCDGLELCFIDEDGDGFGSTDTATSPDLDCTADGESPRDDDCDDAQVRTYPGADEDVADGVDQDCDEGDTCFVDTDGDGFGVEATTTSDDLDCEDPGEASTDGDCDDEDDAAYPGATEEIADGTDQDCDDTELCYVDGDGDGTGTTATAASSDLDCDDPGESSVSTDCDDEDPLAYPEAVEIVADGIDQDCDDGDTCFRDKDGDGFGVGATRSSDDLDCDDPGESSVSTDCADRNELVYPGADEVPVDGKDQDCDGGDLCYEDRDLDGFGTSFLLASDDLDCDDPGESTAHDDCLDTSDRVYPGADEIVADGIDQDCDEGDTCFADTDGDGFGTSATVDSEDLDCADEGESLLDTDCEDGSDLVYPGSEEIVADGQDTDCVPGELCYADADGDHFGTPLTVASPDLSCDDEGESALSTDCDDGDALAYPEADEIPVDGIDQDCDDGDTCFADTDGDGFGSTDTSTSVDMDCLDDGESTTDDDCAPEDPDAYPGADEIVNDGTDQDCDDGDVCFADGDGDGYPSAAVVVSEDLDCDDEGESPHTDLLEQDCHDGEDTIYPGADEIVADGIDQDCDEGDACHLDADADGFGTTETMSSADLDCDDPGESAIDEDCDDGDALAYPEADEIVADGIDQDCLYGDACYADVDGDGFGSDVVITSLDLDCTDDGEAPVDGDCAPESDLAYPGADEIVDDGTDQDCDDGDACYEDGDLDGFGTSSIIPSDDLDCTDDGESALATDCDDDDDDVYPGAPEVVADGEDQDCLYGDACYSDGDGDGFGSDVVVTSLDLDCTDPGESGNAEDCEDGDEFVHPDADEVCDDDDVDEDCDGFVDDEDPSVTGLSTWYLDYDGDGFGVAGFTTESCDAVEGWVDASTDCDDTQPTAYPSAPELCDGILNACGEEMLDGESDGDGDLYVVCAIDAGGWRGDPDILGGEDCDDDDVLAYPDADEVVADGIDQDCDDGDLCWHDGDADGYGTSVPVESADLDCTDDGESTSEDDCDDTSGSTYPGAAWLDPETGCTKDADEDGYGDSTTGEPFAPGVDCDDDDVLAYFGADEVVADGIDQDCDGGDVCFVDGDGDGHGTEATVESDDTDCTDEGESASQDDCDDGDEFAYFGADEVVADGIDQDCDDGDDCFADGDLDTFGGVSVVGSDDLDCDDEGESDRDDDCDDTDADVYPDSHATEYSGDGVDQDCDGYEECRDLNCDGWPDLMFANRHSETSTMFYGSESGFSTDDTFEAWCVDGYHVIFEDLDQDGYRDLLCASYDWGYENDSPIYWGSPTGLSADDVDFLSHEGAIHMTVADLDHDGYRDLVTSNHYNHDGGAFNQDSTITWGSEDGWSERDRTSLPTHGAWDHEVVDLDGDGHEDVVIGNVYDGSDWTIDSYIYWGPGYTTEGRTGLPGIATSDIEVEDLDDDGHLDIVFANRKDGEDFTVDSYVYWGSKAGYSTADRTDLPTIGTREVEVADLDQDGWLDLVFANELASLTNYKVDSYVYWGSEDGFSTADRTELTTEGANDVAVADVDGDGWDDLVFDSYRNDDWPEWSSARLYWGGSTRFVGTGSTDIPNQGGYSVAVGDLDLDGSTDLVYALLTDEVGLDTESVVYYGEDFDVDTRTMLPSYGAFYVDIAPVRLP